MKYAVPMSGNTVATHFGHCEQFALIDVDEEKAKELEINIVSSVYTNGIYDWMICIEAKDVRDAKRFCECLKKEFSGFLQELNLLSKMFSIKKCGIENPEIEKLKDLFVL